jgi:hypothetical protein
MAYFWLWHLWVIAWPIFVGGGNAFIISRARHLICFYFGHPSLFRISCHYILLSSYGVNSGNSLKMKRSVLLMCLLSSGDNELSRRPCPRCIRITQSGMKRISGSGFGITRPDVTAALGKTFRTSAINSSLFRCPRPFSFFFFGFRISIPKRSHFRFILALHGGSKSNFARETFENQCQPGLGDRAGTFRTLRFKVFLKKQRNNKCPLWGE